jgi:transcriptional regulator with XRE-family HTH domain
MLDPTIIRMRRLELRLSQRELGEKLGQDQAYVSRLERGDLKEITVKTLELLATALRISPDTLLGWRGTSDSRRADIQYRHWRDTRDTAQEEDNEGVKLSPVAEALVPA